MPETSHDQPVRVGFTRKGWAALSVVSLLMVGQLAMQLVLLEDQRTSVDRQLAVAASQARELNPTLREARPVLRDAQEAKPEVERLRRRSLELAEVTTPLVRDLRDARVAETSREVGALARTLLSARLPRLSEALQDVIGETRARDLVAKSARAADTVPRQLAVLEQSRDIQRQTLDAQRAALELNRQILAIARETERHAESIDRKTGGSPPAATGTPVP